MKFYNWTIILALLLLPVLSHSAVGKYSTFTQEGFPDLLYLLDTETGEIYEIGSEEDSCKLKWVKAVDKPGRGYTFIPVRENIHKAEIPFRSISVWDKEAIEKVKKEQLLKGKKVSEHWEVTD